MITHLGVVQSQPAVDGERFEGFFVTFVEHSVQFVHHLYHSNHTTTDVYRHTKYRFRFVASLLVDISANGDSIIYYDICFDRPPMKINEKYDVD